MEKQEKEIISRWGNPIADDRGYITIPGWILRNYHKCKVSPLEMMFVAHVMSFKYDHQEGKPENAAKPSLATVAGYMGRDVKSVRRLKQSLIDKKLLKVSHHEGMCDEYDFGGMTNLCLNYELNPNGQFCPSRESSTPPKSVPPTPPKNGSTPLPKMGDEELEMKLRIEELEDSAKRAANATLLHGAPDTPPEVETAQSDHAAQVSGMVDHSQEGIQETPPNASPPPPSYRAITVDRKWAERIASGAKRFEVRDFRTDYRGPLVVTISGEKIAYCIVDLVDIGLSQSAGVSDEERTFGKWAWLLHNPRRVESVPCVGQLGIWTWHGELPRAVVEQDSVTWGEFEATLMAHAQGQRPADQPHSRPVGNAASIMNSRSARLSSEQADKVDSTRKPMVSQKPADQHIQDHPTVPTTDTVVAAGTTARRILDDAPDGGKPKRAAINQVLKDAVAIHLQGIEPGLAGDTTWLIANKAAGLWVKKLGRALTADDYQSIARSLDGANDRGFPKWFRGKCKGCDLPSQSPANFEGWYSKFMTALDTVETKQHAAEPTDDEREEQRRADEWFEQWSADLDRRKDHGSNPA